MLRLFILLIVLGVMMRLAKSGKTLGLLSMSSFIVGKGSQSHSSASCSKLQMSTLVDTNPLLRPKNVLPNYADITPEHVEPAVTSELEKMKKEFSNLEQILDNPQKGEPWQSRRIEYDYAMVVEALEKIGFPLSHSWGIVNHLMGVKNSDELRAAHEKLQKPVIEAFQSLSQSAPVFKALTALKQRQSVWSELDVAQKRIVESAIRRMENSGVGLEGVEKEKFNQLQLEAADLSTKFSNNVLDSTKAFKMEITDPKDVEGLPDSAKAMFAAKAKEDGAEGATAEAGPWTITLDAPAYIATMYHIKNRDLREKLYRAFVTRASIGDKDNAPLIKRILQIRKEMCTILGYSCHADKSLASKMAGSVKEVEDLTEMLWQKAYPAAQKELAELREFAASQGFNGDLQLWDVAYYGERLREQRYEFSEEELKPYFALPNVLEGLFGLANRLFGIRIEKADGETQVWNNDVQYFKIFDDKTGDFLASFYLDAYSRPADKRGGAWMDAERGASKVLDMKPVAYLTCNGSPPVGDKPSLMTFREVETLFHEFGHGLQHMLTRVPHGDAAGINNVEWDAVELPSQFMENWCYDKPTVDKFAKHYETGEPLPIELFNKIKAAKNFQSGMGMIRQLFFGAMDMYIHSDKYDPNGDRTVFDVQHELAKKYTVIPPLPEDRFLNAFGHIFSGGYSAGYYSYKWAEVMSADAFGAFEEAGLDNEEAVKEIGMRFRNTVLSKGGGEHPSDVYKAFRGRDPSPEALLRHSGLSDE